MRAVSTAIGLIGVSAMLAVVARTAKADPGTIVTFPVGDGTLTTFTVSAGPLSITAPASKALGTAGQSGSITSGLGTVVVTDERALIAPTWTATVSSTDFTTGGASAAETIAKSQVNYWSGAAGATSGSGATFVPGQPTADDQVGLDTAPTVLALTSGLGNNSASVQPTVVVSVPSNAIAGLYTGTITHSVA